MALGTPVDGGAAYSNTNGTSVSPAYPAGIQAGDCVVLIVGQKPSTANGGTVTTPTGWTLRDSALAQGGYGATLQADQGNTNLYIYTKNTVLGNETGNLTVTVGTNSVSWGLIIRIPAGSGGGFQYGTADSGRATAPTSGVAFTNLLTNGASAPNLSAGDMAIFAMCIPTDVLGGTGFSAPTISSTGTTFGTAVELEEPFSPNGTDIAGFVAYAAATSGTSTAAPTIGATATGTVTNVRGPLVLLRIREAFIDAEVGSFTYTGQDTTNTVTRALDAEDAAFTYTGEDATLSRTYSFNAEVGTFTYTGQDAELTKTSAPKILDAEVGTFSYLGQDATNTVTRALDAEAGTFDYTGEDATLNRTYSFDAEDGTFTYTGEPATLNRSYSFNAEVGVFTYTGENAELLYTQTKAIDAQVGTFNYTGEDTTLNRTYVFNAETGAFVYTGEPATLAAGVVVNAETGVFTYTGQNATFNVAATFDAGSFTYTGQDATFLRSTAFNAEQTSFGEANPYVDNGYVNPGYVTGLTAALLFGRAFVASAGVFTYTGQNATLTIGTLYPPENVVLAGVIYGPGGIYEGTYVCPPAQNKQILYIFDD